MLSFYETLKRKSFKIEQKNNVENPEDKPPIFLEKSSKIDLQNSRLLRVTAS